MASQNGTMKIASITPVITPVAINRRPPRVGRNPKSGEKVHVPEKYVPHFKAGKELRERVDSELEAAAKQAQASR